MHDFPANSAKARARSEQPLNDGPRKIERVTTADRRPRTLGRRFKETFLGADAKTTLEYMVVDVAVPGIRDIMFDVFQSGLERMIYGESRVRRGGYYAPTQNNQPRINYNAMSTGKPTSSGRMLSRQSRARHNFDEIVIQSHAEALDVLDTMYEWLSRYGRVSVAELYEMTDINSSHQDHKWGWTALTGAKVARLRNGTFVLDLPEPQPL